MTGGLSSPQLSDALREHAAVEVKHAARSHVLMAMADDMLREHRDRIRTLERELEACRTPAVTNYPQAAMTQGTDSTVHGLDPISQAKGESAKSGLNGQDAWGSTVTNPDVQCARTGGVCEYRTEAVPNDK